MRLERPPARLSAFRHSLLGVLVFPGALLSCVLLACPPAAYAQNSVAAPSTNATPPASPGAAAATGAPASPAGNELPGADANSDENKDSSGPPPLSEYNNVPTNMMIPEQAVTKDENGNDIVDSHLNTGVKTGYETLLKLYQEGKFEEVAKGLAPLAAVAHHGAQELLGIMYEQGQGVTKDPHKAYDLLMQAADAGNRPLAQHHLGVMYYQGDGVSKDPIMALMWLHIAIVHYPDGTEKARAVKDRDSIYTQLTRREKERALQLAREWLGKKGESDLLDLQGN